MNGRRSSWLIGGLSRFHYQILLLGDFKKREWTYHIVRFLRGQEQEPMSRTHELKSQGNKFRLDTKKNCLTVRVLSQWNK